jgi:hypothetical protein
MEVRMKKFSKLEKHLSLFLFLIFVSLAIVAGADLHDHLAVPGSLPGVASWRVLGPSSAEVLSGLAYDGDLISVSSTAHIGCSTYPIAGAFESASSKVFLPVNTSQNLAAIENLAITNITATITVNLTSPTTGAGFEVFSAAGNVGVQGNVTINAKAGSTINGAANITFTNVTNNAWPRMQFHAYNSTVWQASY